MFSCKVQRKSGGVEVTSETTKAAVTFDPFQVDFYVNGEIAVVLNSRGLMNVEHLRNKKYVPDLMLTQQNLQLRH